MAKSPPIDLIPTSAPEPLVDLLYDSALTVPVNKRNNFAATGYVRFLLAFVVIVSHARWYCNFSVPFIKVWPDAQAGVLGFFVLSGWVIASSVNRETKGFYLRRIERLLPVYIVCLLWAQVPWLLFGSSFVIPIDLTYTDPPHPWMYLANVLFLQGFLNATEVTFSPAWSMSCEAFYYLLAPDFRKTTTKLLAIVAAVSLAAYLLKDIFNIDNVDGAPFGLPCLLLAWSWLAGFIAFRLKDKYPVASGVLLLCVGAFWQQGSGYLAVLAALAILFGDRINFSERAAKFGEILGDLSYPLYLSHLATLMILAKFLPETLPGRTLVALAGAILFSMIVLIVIDKPLQTRFKRGRFAPVPTA